MTRDIMAELNWVFHPRSVAIIGASNREGSFGRVFVEGLIRMGFKNIYPVHPRDKDILGLSAYTSVHEIPGEVDLAIVLTPPGAVLEVVEECAKKGLKGVVIYTAGFGETGEEGKKIERDIARIARHSGTRVIGPNSIGIYCPSARLLSFPLGLLEGLPRDSGPVGAFSQSGSFVDLLVCNTSAKGIRFSKVVSSGNECDLEAADFLEYLGQDTETKIIVAYLEGVNDGKRFYQLAQQISMQKPIIMWKAGTTETGAKAAFSHTGALAGSSRVWEAMFRQAGIISVSSFEEVIDCLVGFYYLPLPKGRRIAIVSGPGGAAVGASDSCIRLGLDLAKLSDYTRTRLAQAIPPVGTSADNPVDLGPGVLLRPQVYGEAIKILAEDENVDMLLVIAISDRECSQSIFEVVRGIDKPVVVAMTVLPEIDPSEYQFLMTNGILSYADAKRAAVVLAKLADYVQFREGS